MIETKAEFLMRMQREFDADDAPYQEDWQKLINLARRGAEAADEIERLRAALRDEPTQEQIYNACMSYRHDFGLLSVDERKIVAFTAKEWLRAWQKTLARAALGEKA